MCSYAWIDFSSTQGRRPREPSASTGTSFGARDDVELFTTLASVVRSYSHNKVAPIGYYFEPDLRLWKLNAFAARFFGVVQFSVDARFGRFLRLVAAWQFGTGVLWASVACVFRQLHTDSATSCPRVACYCAFAAQSGGGWWLAGDGARCLSVRGTRTWFRDRAAGDRTRVPGFTSPGRTRVTCCECRTFATSH